MTSQELIEELEAQRNLMIDVATGGSRFQEVNDDFKERRERIRGGLLERNLSDLITFSDLWSWHAKWSDGTLPTYKERRQYLNRLLDPLIEQVRQFKPLTDYDQVIANIDNLDGLELDVNSYYGDSEYSSFVDEWAFPKVKLLHAHLKRLGFSDLIEEMENIRLEEGRYVRIIETLRGFIFPETRTRVQALKKEAPPTEPQMPQSEEVLPHSLVSNTRGYIEKIVFQINGTYEQGWFDACAVMIRRLIETLIIEAFENHNIAGNIKSPSGDYLYLRDLINRTLTETAWNLGRNTKTGIPHLKDIGDQSAHSRRFIAQRADIQNIIPDLRTVVQELLFLAGLK